MGPGGAEKSFLWQQKTIFHCWILTSDLRPWPSYQKSRSKSSNRISTHRQTDGHTHGCYQTYDLPCYAVDKNQQIPVFWESSGTTVSGPLLRGDNLVDMRTGDTSTVCTNSDDLLDFDTMPYITVQSCRHISYLRGFKYIQPFFSSPRYMLI